MPRVSRNSPRVDDTPLARELGVRLRQERLAAGLTQQQLADGRYTKAYVSALENGLSRPSMSALTFFAAKLGLPPSRLLNEKPLAWARLDADLALASGNWDEAIDAYRSAAGGSHRPGSPGRTPPRNRRGARPARQGLRERCGRLRVRQHLPFGLQGGGCRAGGILARGRAVSARQHGRVQGATRGDSGACTGRHEGRAGLPAAPDHGSGQQ